MLTHMTTILCSQPCANMRALHFNRGNKLFPLGGFLYVNLGIYFLAVAIFRQLALTQFPADPISIASLTIRNKFLNISALAGILL